MTGGGAVREPIETFAHVSVLAAYLLLVHNEDTLKQNTVPEHASRKNSLS